ncbi:hypothetical protein M011DRAFT_72408 [Sporormia fimetaria CBS 119925]|uniref:MARVEL domain-containing protein n=1 Tax=Sporormia fimetaria CBS 119925 TaxID=1340428 RepID=A0A6A6VA35_9PLEO|nr:hypothetical protein M011DRAFT_72408 [Sporormia fimetaria CBS 119925]
MGLGDLSNKVVRFLVSASNFVVFASAAIVVGITGYFLKNFTHDHHLIYEIIIGALTLFFWLPSFIVPFIGRIYRQYYLPMNLIFSYLWLTAFIFASQDYSRGRCLLNAPPFGRCSLKRANQAFIFLAFIFSVISTVADLFSLRGPATATTHVEKDVRPSVDTATV